MPAHRKLVKHFHEPGDLHELTFSCYRRRPLLTNDPWRSYLSESLNYANERFNFHLVAFVFMPEHVHLLMLPLDVDAAIDRYLAAVKRPVSAAVKRDLQSAQSPLLSSLTIRERPSKDVFRFWQEGPGYDRNLRTATAILKSIDYIHENPVRRGLCSRSADWKWSSARWFDGPASEIEPGLPKLAMLPTDFGWRVST